MYTVGIDVDTLVSSKFSNIFISTGLFAGTPIEFIFTFNTFKDNKVEIIINQGKSAGNFRAYSLIC
jgi:hypothetical protein